MRKRRKRTALVGAALHNTGQHGASGPRTRLSSEFIGRDGLEEPPNPLQQKRHHTSKLELLMLEALPDFLCLHTRGRGGRPSKSLIWRCAANFVRPVGM